MSNSVKPSAVIADVRMSVRGGQLLLDKMGVLFLELMLVLNNMFDRGKSMLGCKEKGSVHKLI